MIKTLTKCICLIFISGAMLFNCNDKAINCKIEAINKSEIRGYYYIYNNIIYYNDQENRIIKEYYNKNEYGEITDFKWSKKLEKLIIITKKAIGNAKKEILLIRAESEQKTLILLKDTILENGSLRIFNSPFSSKAALFTENENSFNITIIELKNGDCIDYRIGNVSELSNSGRVFWNTEDTNLLIKYPYYLYNYSNNDKNLKLLETINLRDVLTEECLLKQGYLGTRIDYIGLIGKNETNQIVWSPTGETFVYTSKDTVYNYDLKEKTKATLQILPNPNETQIEPIWKELQYRENFELNYSNNDKVVECNTNESGTALRAKNIYCENVFLRQTIPAIRIENKTDTMRMNERYYLIYGQCGLEKIKFAELDFTMFYYGIIEIPRKAPWRAYENKNTAYIDSCNAFKKEYEQYYKQIEETMNDFVEYEIANKFLRYAYRNLCFYKEFCDLIIDKNLNKFAKSMQLLFEEGDDKEKLNKLLDALREDTTAIKYTNFHDTIYNLMLNYYGLYFDKEMKKKLEEENIEQVKLWFMLKRITNDDL